MFLHILNFIYFLDNIYIVNVKKGRKYVIFSEFHVFLNEYIKKFKLNFYIPDLLS